jgi:hypothetical protein
MALWSEYHRVSSTIVGTISQDRDLLKKVEVFEVCASQKACDIRCTSLRKVTEGVVELRLCSIAVA